MSNSLVTFTFHQIGNKRNNENNTPKTNSLQISPQKQKHHNFNECWYCSVLNILYFPFFHTKNSCRCRIYAVQVVCELIYADTRVGLRCAMHSRCQGPIRGPIRMVFLWSVRERQMLINGPRTGAIRRSDEPSSCLLYMWFQ